MSLQSLAVPLCPQAGDEGKACAPVLREDPCWKRQKGGGSCALLGFCPYCSEGKASCVSQAARLTAPGSREIRGSCTVLPCRQATAAALSTFCCSPGPASKTQVSMSERSVLCQQNGHGLCRLPWIRICHFCYRFFHPGLGL